MEKSELYNWFMIFEIDDEMAAVLLNGMEDQDQMIINNVNKNVGLPGLANYRQMIEIYLDYYYNRSYYGVE